MKPPTDARPASPARPRGHRRRRIALVAAAALVAALLLTEGAFRALLFHDVPGMRRASARLRQPASFFARHDPGYWLFGAHLRAMRRDPPTTGLHPLLGWVGPDVDRETLAHANESLLVGRTPVLLYGDSFSRCTTERVDCWEGLMQRSELRRSHLLLNYGVGGYGLDQTWLMLRESLARFRGEGRPTPVVIVGVMVDDDLDRSTLPFRSRPKPRFTLTADGTLDPGPPIPEGIARYLDQHPPPGGSYAWRFLKRRFGIGAESAERAHRDEVVELTRAILGAAKAELDPTGIPWFVAIFHGHVALGEDGWREALLTDTLSELAIPYVSSRTEIEGAIRGGAITRQEFFVWEGEDEGHYTPEGNAVVFPMLLRGIRGEFDGGG